VKEKRLKIRIENVDRKPISKDYHYLLKNAILLKIEEYDTSLAEQAHDKWDYFFSFSSILGKMYNSELGLFFRDGYLYVSSPSSEFISGLKKALFVNPLVRIGNVSILASEIRDDIIEINEGFSTIYYETLGEVVIKKEDRTGTTKHLTLNDDINKGVHDEISKQFKGAYNSDATIGLEIVSAKQKQKAVIKDGKKINSFIALRLTFKLSADCKVHEFLLTQGFGHRRKLGFGMVSPIKKNEVKHDI
jgi:CRISPR-associated endoribonuclease Cas6